jgi:acetylornithine/LysW-gamma-L-lysine aminotransferase
MCGQRTHVQDERRAIRLDGKGDHAHIGSAVRSNSGERCTALLAQCANDGRNIGLCHTHILVSCDIPGSCFIYHRESIMSIPSPFTTHADIMAHEDGRTSGAYTKRGLAIVRGHGATLWDADNRCYIDCVGGQGSANLGHGHPAVVAAIQAQAATLIHCPEIFHNDQRAAYLTELGAALPEGLGRIFLCNSGTEAVEAALKFARLITGRSAVVAAMRGFHGRTMGALSATYEPKYREPFEPLIPGVSHVPFNNVAKLAAAVNTDTAAVILEPVQGEGGVRPADSEFLRVAADLCRTHGALLLIDEVQTGFGRTGSLFAITQFGITPDVLIMAKSMAGGIPMGAIAMHERWGGFTPSSHGSTFGGNPLACAAARATLKALLDDDIPAQAARKGAHLMRELAARNLSHVREIRGRGLLIGIELKERVQPTLATLMERGLLALPAGPNVLRLLPPLIISDAEIDQVVDIVSQVLA